MSEHQPAPNLAAEALGLLRPDEEEAYLISLLTTITARDLRDEALTRVMPDDFVNGHYGGLWEAAQKVHASGKQVTARSVAAAADTHNENAERILSGFMGSVPHPRDFPHAIGEVLRCSGLRKVVLATVRIQQRAMSSEDGSAALGAAFEELSKLDQGSASDKYTHSFGDLLQRLETSWRSPDAHEVIPTPWPDVNDRIAGGLHSGRMYVVGGRPGEGKSIVGHQVAEHAASRGMASMVFSVEMGGTEVAGRMVSSGARIEMDEISRRKLSEHSWRKFAEYQDQAYAYPLIVNEKPSLTLPYIMSECRAAKRRSGLKLVVVDYLQLLKGDRTDTREQQVAGISRSLKQMSRELDVAVVVPAQLNRGPASRGRPLLSDLRESGGIEADADVVMLLARQFDEKTGKPAPFVTIDLAKNRQGRVGSLELPFRGHYSSIG